MIIDRPLNIRHAALEDLSPIAELLAQNALPYTDLIQSKVELIVAYDQDMMMGCAGLQRYGQDALLRSVAVKKDFQKQGIGSILFDEVKVIAKTTGIDRIHLLTETAQDYWAAKGFKKTERSMAPENISSSSEFGNLCPSSAIYMVVEL
ncbi:MAG: GNAT family N-acetyltransferase [Saprospiraceae bacterium]|jgi:amino-acid N-acetyltransferase|nr:GNAT family N-acetyltransferase [Saprospiraceae bacterium]MBK6815598.1 GNAT family N-acetyltransferase [Saprospiraceae bacterium]MBK7373972.1 GNAT family N-acetyltransferase [Saprospiraceae bacterium]MBK7439263.1 GNAT family N-acetyltransferase [Saprospiraceae bacterium]MBK7605704.1 GNAT family N-acetyltransferase [Saprospiraceae bacterium]